MADSQHARPDMGQGFGRLGRACFLCIIDQGWEHGSGVPREGRHAEIKIKL